MRSVKDVLVVATIVQIAAIATASPPPDRTAFLARLDTLHVEHRVDEVEAIITPLLPRARAEADSSFLQPLAAKLGRLYASYGKPRDGESLLAEAADLAAALHDTLAWCDALRWLGLSVEQLGRQDEARTTYQRLRDLALATGDTRHEAWSLVGLAFLATRNGLYTDAERDYRRAADLFHDRGEVQPEVWALNGLAVALQDAGRTSDSVSCLNRVVGLARDVGYEAVEALAENNLGALEFATGDPGLAQRHYERAYELQIALAQRADAVITGCNEVDCLIELGRYDEAEALLDTLQFVCRDGGFRDREPAVKIRRARLRRLQGRNREAKRIVREALASDTDVFDIEDRCECLVGLATSLAFEDSLDAALAVLEEGTRLWGSRAGGQASVNLSLALGRAELEAGRDERAVATLTRVAEQARSQTLFRHLFEALEMRAAAERRLGRDAEALASLRDAALVWEDVRDAPRDPAWREQRSATNGSIAASLAGLMLGHRDSPVDTAAVFDAVQVFKARTMAERIRDRRGVETWRPVRKPTTATKLQTQVLAEDELLLDYYLGDDESYLFVVGGGSVEVVRLAAGDELEAKARVLRDVMSTWPRDGHVEAASAIAVTMARALFGEAAPRIAASHELVVIPDGALNLVPFAVLSSAGAVWSRCPSATILAGLRDDDAGRSRGEGVLAFASELMGDGRPLPGAVSEARSLAARYEHVDLHVAGLLSPPLDAEELRGRSVLHLATHARADDRRPWWSEIDLGPDRDGEPNATLRADVIAVSDYAADLVVLSACETAGGRILSGEGVLGLSSAFLAAGSPVVVASLWPVEDRAAGVFMDVFYRALAGGHTVAEALAAAGEDLRKDPATAHPFYWSAFVAVGDGNVMIDLRTKRHRGTSVGVVIAGLTCGFLLLRRRRWFL